MSQGDTTSQADGINLPLGRLKRRHDLSNKRTVQKVLRNFDFNSLVGFYTQKIRHLFPIRFYLPYDSVLSKYAYNPPSLWL